MATPTLRAPYGVSSPYTVDDPGVLKNPFGLGTGGGGGTGPQGPTGPSGHGSTTTTAAPSASGGNWIFTLADTTAFSAVGLPIYCSDGTNSIRGHVVSVASSTQLTVAPDSTSGTVTSIANGSTFTFSGVAGATGPAGANASVYVGTTTNSGNAYTATPSPAIASYITGTLYTAQFNAANTGAVTLNISGLGAKNVYLNGAALTGGEIAANAMTAVTYDGTQFNMTGDGRGGSGGTSITNAGDLPGIIDWWRADLGTNTTTNGANVSSWAGQKGVYTFSATSGHYPTYVTSAVGGQPALAFNGSNQFMSCASVALSTFCILVFFRATGAPGIICEHSVNSNTNNGCYLYGSTVSTINVRRTGILDGKNLYGNWAVDGNWHSVIYTHSGGVIGHRISIDGFDMSATANGGVSSNPDNTSTVTDTLYLMMRAGSANATNGSLAEFAICSGPLTTAYRRAWFDYINSRYGTAF